MSFPPAWKISCLKCHLPHGDPHFEPATIQMLRKSQSAVWIEPQSDPAGRWMDLDILLSSLLYTLSPLLNLGHSPNAPSLPGALLCSHRDAVWVCSCLHGAPMVFALGIASAGLLPNTQIGHSARFTPLLPWECPQLKTRSIHSYCFPVPDITCEFVMCILVWLFLFYNLAFAWFGCWISGCSWLLRILWYSGENQPWSPGVRWGRVGFTCALCMELFGVQGTARSCSASASCSNHTTCDTEAVFYCSHCKKPPHEPVLVLIWSFILTLGSAISNEPPD